MKKKPRTSKGMTVLTPGSLKRTNPGKRLYTIPELLGITGISRKQVAYWAQIKLLNPVMRATASRAGSPTSFYSPQEVVKAMIISDLKRAGFSLRQIHQVARNLEANGIRLDKNENYLLTDGYSVFSHTTTMKSWIF